MAASAVESLIALSDTICPPLPHSSPVGHGNFFGPWLTDTKWSPRKHPTEVTVAPKKKATPRSSQVSKSLPRRLSLFTSPNINNSPYGAQRSSSPADDNIPGRSKLKLTTRAKPFIASDGSRRQSKTKVAWRKGSKISIKKIRGNTEDDEGEEDELGEEEEEENVKRSTKHFQFQKPALPALITLTSNTNDTRSTFALGRQLELPLPKVYVSVGQKESARITPRATSATLPLFNAREEGSTDVMMSRQMTWQNTPNLNNGPGRSLSYISNSGGRDVSQCRAEALKRALDMCNPPPPTHEYEDISQHMRHYRIHCTVLGTGRFSLANEPVERDVKPVQWRDLFPHRPLTAVGSIVDVPIFRFSVADFRIQTAPSTKGNRSTPPPAPRSATPRYLAPDDALAGQEARSASYTNMVKVEDSSDTSSDSDEKLAVEVTVAPGKPGESNPKSGSLELEERFARASRVANVTMCEDKPQQDEKLKAKQQADDNEYMQYLRAKNNAVKQTSVKQRASVNPNESKKSVKNTKLETKSGTRNTETKRSLVTAEVCSEDEEDEYFRHKTKKKASKEPKLRKGSNFAARKCEGQYGPTTKFFRSVTDLVSKGRHYTDINQATKLPAPRLVVDADRLKESVEIKIDEGERKFRSSINEAVLSQIISSRNNNRLWQKIHQRDSSFSTAPSFKKQSTAISIRPTQNISVDDSLQNVADTNSPLNSFDYSDDDDNEESNFDNKTNSRSFMKNDNRGEADATGELPRKKNIGLVTSYDFKGYVEALRARTERSLGNKDELEEESKMSEDDDETSPVPCGVSRKRNWRPKESRVRSAARGGRYRTRYPKMSEVRSKSRDSTSDDMEGFPYNSTSARLRYKPTSPATSAFVIAAPPNSNTTGIGGRSVVLPLEEFMEMAVDNKDQSFADWKTCLNNSSPGFISRSQVGAGQRSRSDGLLKVVSFATPVNQFIFAKKITFDSTDNLGIFPFNNKKKNRLEERRNDVADNVGTSSRYRLKLSDFGLPRSFRKKSTSKDDSDLGSGKSCELSENTSNEKPDKSVRNVEEAGQFKQDKLQLLQSSNTAGVSSCEVSVRPFSEVQKDDLTQGREKVVMDSPASLPVSHPKEETSQPPTAGITRAYSAHEKSKQAKTRSVSAEAHACLRKEILRLMEHRKSTNENEKSDVQSASVEGRKNWSGNSTIKGVPDSNTEDEQNKEKPSKQAMIATASDPSGAFAFRINRQSSSLSPRRLTLKHRPRRHSERERSLSPSRIHTYFQRRRSTPEVRQDDQDSNLPPLTIQGGGISRPSSEKPEAKTDPPASSDTASKSEAIDIDSVSTRLKGKTSTEVKENSQNKTESGALSELNNTALPDVKEFQTVHEDVQMSDSMNKARDKVTDEDNSSANMLRKSQTNPKKVTKYVRFSAEV